jgi:hypothetical protein
MKGNEEVASTSTYKRHRTEDGQVLIGKKTCSTCGLKGHVTTTCRMNPNRSRVAEKKAPKRGGTRKRARPRTKQANSEERE